MELLSIGKKRLWDVRNKQRAQKSASNFLPAENIYGIGKGRKTFGRGVDFDNECEATSRRDELHEIPS
jgi:hypothetical protein